MNSKQKTQMKAKASKPRNFVAESEILTQAINVENKHIRINSEFAFNPRKINVVATAPLTGKTADEKGVVASKENTEAIQQFNEYLKTELQQFYETPNHKQKYPITSSQQIGWFSDWVS